MNHIKASLSGDTSSAIAILCHFVHTAETTLTTAQIKNIEVEDIKKRYKGKTAVKTDQRVITKAHVIAAEEVLTPHNTKLAKEQVAAETVISKRNQPATQNKRKARQFRYFISIDCRVFAKNFSKKTEFVVERQNPIQTQNGRVSTISSLPPSILQFNQYSTLH